MTPFHPLVCPSQPATWPPYTPTACRLRGWPSAYRRLCRGQQYAEGLRRGLSWRPPTPTATTFGRRRRHQPSASPPIPVVLLFRPLQKSIHMRQKIRNNRRKIMDAITEDFPSAPPGMTCVNFALSLSSNRRTKRSSNNSHTKRNLAPCSFSSSPPVQEITGLCSTSWHQRRHRRTLSSTW
jgi:hypothetical protein